MANQSIEHANSNIVSPREMATRLDHVHSSLDFDKVYDDLAKTTEGMSKSDTLSYMRQVAGFDKKGTGADLNINGSHIVLTSPYESTDIGVTGDKSK